MKAYELEWQGGHPSQQLRHNLGVDAELLRSPAHLHPRGLQLEVRIDPDRDLGRPAAPPADVGQYAELALGFDIDDDAGGDGPGELGIGLARAGKADAPRL